MPDSAAGQALRGLSRASRLTEIRDPPAADAAHEPVRSIRRKMILRAALTRELVVVRAGRVSTAKAAPQGGVSCGARAAIKAPQFDARRLPTPPLRPPVDGIGHWSTPDQDGNLGGPGTGERGGGGG